MSKNATVQYIKISKVVPDPEQPRKYFAADKLASLRASIKRDGILTPLALEPIPKSDKFSIVDGERRFRAAIEEGFDEVPFIVLQTKDPIDKLLQQFQIQEMHENWTPIEKALALMKLSEEMEISIGEVCKMLGVGERLTRSYKSFAAITDKNSYLKGEIPLDYAEHFVGVKNLVKHVKNVALKEPFERGDEKAVERALISRIKEGSIRSAKDFAKVKDSILTNPKFLEKFLETNISPEAMFYESKAQGAYHLRNAVTSANYTKSHLSKFFDTMDVKLTDTQIAVFKSAAKTIKELLDRIGE